MFGQLFELILKLKSNYSMYTSLLENIFFENSTLITCRGKNYNQWHSKISTVLAETNTVFRLNATISSTISYLIIIRVTRKQSFSISGLPEKRINLESFKFRERSIARASGKINELFPAFFFFFAKALPNCRRRYRNTTAVGDSLGPDVCGKNAFPNTYLFFHRRLVETQTLVVFARAFRRVSPPPPPATHAPVRNTALRVYAIKFQNGFIAYRGKRHTSPAPTFPVPYRV